MQFSENSILFHSIFSIIRRVLCMCFGFFIQCCMAYFMTEYCYGSQNISCSKCVQARCLSCGLLQHNLQYLMPSHYIWSGIDILAFISYFSAVLLTFQALVGHLLSINCTEDKISWEVFCKIFDSCHTWFPLLFCAWLSHSCCNVLHHWSQELKGLLTSWFVLQAWRTTCHYNLSVASIITDL